MIRRYSIKTCGRWLVTSLVGVTGCASPQIVLPPGHLPQPTAQLDAQTTGILLTASSPTIVPQKKEPAPGPPSSRPPFELPPGLPGAATPGITPPRYTLDTPPTERLKAVQASFPELQGLADSPVKKATANEQAMTLADLQQLAMQNSPVLQRAMAEAEVSYGQVIQAGLYPNPTVGYQADQIQPSLAVPPGSGISGAGQQGGFINQLIITAGKLTLARKVAGFDYINALVAVRRAQVNVTANVRAKYFAALVAQQGVQINRSLVQLADEVYQLQLNQVAAGQAAGYEPLQLYAQAEQARNALTQSENAYAAAWKQLAAAVGRPELPLAPLAGQVDTNVPPFDQQNLEARLLEQHTDLLTARNMIAQSQANLVLQKRKPIPDVETNSYHQYDNIAQTYQFGVQVGLSLPLFDRNQGNIKSAQSQIWRNAEDLRTTQNELIGQLAEAYARYNANRVICERYRDKIVPNLGLAYRALVRRYQVEPDKVSFNDIVVAQQNLAQALQAYLSSLDAQWQAVVDVANISQLDELYISAGSPK